MTRFTLLLVAIFGFLLAGCGQSGPLYLPGDPSEIQQAPKPVETASEADEEDPEEKEFLEIEWGMDFGARHETVLTKKFDRPVFVYGYPTQVKAFYMEPMPGRPEACKSVDLLAPEGYGEIIGGSERMSDPDLLLQRIHEHGLPEEAFKWYLQLRQFGSVPHSGFGMGVERTVAWICGTDHIRETIPFPRTIKRVYP